MPTPRQVTVAVTLPDGRIAVAGGNSGNISTLAAGDNELYDPTANTWSTGAPMPFLLIRPVAALRADGRMIVTGGNGASISTANQTTFVYDPALNTWATGTMTTGIHFAGYAARTPDGRVYVISGRIVVPTLSTVVDALY
jgi:N-acetylneuraminic acid mutarotase